MASSFKSAAAGPETPFGAPSATVTTQASAPELSERPSEPVGKRQKLNCLAAFSGTGKHAANSS